ncbi:MAG: alpha/beta fold hydrolase [Roseateles sp.]|uniref:esterase/lipase family protein n=1 Tax=Roseateles sp. TaxID=1971397 RepID=UPI0039EC2622
MNSSTALAPPPRLLQWLEWRAMGEMTATALLAPTLALAPRGDGHPVLVLPGLAASDRSTLLLRAFLRDRGYQVHGWGQGRNLGPRDGVRETMLAQLDRIADASGRQVSVVGWSLGGMYARMLAQERPDAVRGVVMLGSPVGGHPYATRAWRLYEMASGRSAHEDAREWSGAVDPDTVPRTSIWSRSDGIVAWRNSVVPVAARSENITVYGSHLGLGANAAVLYAVGDRLAQPQGQWQAFKPPALLRALYPRVDAARAA